MRGGWRSPRPLTGWIAAGLLTSLVGCVASAEAMPEPSVGPPPASATTAPVEPSSSPTPQPTLPPTLLEPSEPPVATATPTPPQPTPTPKPSPRYDPPAKPGPFEMNLYRRGAFASPGPQHHFGPGAL